MVHLIMPVAFMRTSRIANTENILTYDKMNRISLI
jgi:hypothetical protein